MAKYRNGSLVGARMQHNTKGTITPTSPLASVTTCNLLFSYPSRLTWYSSKRNGPLNADLGAELQNQAASLLRTPPKFGKIPNFPPKASSTPTGAILKHRRRQSSEVALCTASGLQVLSPIRPPELKKSRLNFDKHYTLIGYEHRASSTNDIQLNGDGVPCGASQVVLKDFAEADLLGEFRNDSKLNGRNEARVVLVRLEESTSKKSSLVPQRRDLQSRKRAEVGWRKAKVKEESVDTSELITTSVNGKDLNATRIQSCRRMKLLFSQTRDISGDDKEMPTAQRRTKQIRKAMRCSRQANATAPDKKQLVKPERHEQLQEVQENQNKPSRASKTFSVTGPLLPIRRKTDHKPPLPDAVANSGVVHRTGQTQDLRLPSESNGEDFSKHSLQRTIPFIRERNETQRTQNRSGQTVTGAQKDKNDTLVKNNGVFNSGTRNNVSLLKSCRASRKPQSTPKAEKTQTPATGLTRQAHVRLVDILQVRPKSALVSKTKPSSKPATANNCKPTNSTVEKKIKKEDEINMIRLPLQMPAVPQHELKYWTKYELKHVSVSVVRLPL
ncbi:uncharacterized protein LOC111245806 isoform X2 [Varroa destructor]|nr:uncharacterized protein LOC111245806 isoform X2 [Varroa destructor]XP_022650347.1 uncharacterized protein LOC111245806 isoform X2 [Varroa destructor]XP_022650348.1 uncharacterized protein LOC111245806 isoform X2 [Varroa destructor]XP_022650349.1 uncharacterized protein LOC111245806 isoform X2 [Varroa destructor]XP_022650351.1 uncharacterized protein LOC111245806 isoform X2 [Varroa destructor]